MTISAFYAYTSSMPQVALSIKNAIETVNSGDYPLEIVDWRKLPGSSSQQIITKVTEEILNCDLFFCDLTLPNENVLFELGFAIANGKKFWLTMDSNLRDRETFDKHLKLLTSLDNVRYQSGAEIVSRMMSDAPFADTESRYNLKIIKPITDNMIESPTLFYLKSGIPTDESNDLSRFLKENASQLVTDDVGEVSSRPLDWYIEHVFRSYGVIAHFLDEDRNKTNKRNYLYAFVSGIAYGFGKPVLMLTHTPHNKVSVDFRDIMRSHRNPEDCVNIAAQWLTDNESKYESLRLRRAKKAKKIRSTRLLQSINLGEYVAEDEENSLSEYFYETSIFSDALKVSNYMIYVGRKGSGKTANLYQIAKETQRNKNYHVCVIKPIDYEFEGIFELYQKSKKRSFQSYLIESLWKFLIFTELGKTVYEEIRHTSYNYSEQEKSLIEFVDSNSEIIMKDFATRMEEAVNDLLYIDEREDHKRRISEELHQGIIGRLRILLGDVLGEKEKVLILF